MTNEELQQHINAIRTAVRRGEVEISDAPGSIFRLINPNDFMPDRLIYRIRPQPREVYVCLTCNEITNLSEPADGHDIRKFREVLDD